MASPIVHIDDVKTRASMDRRSPSQLSPPPRRTQFDVEDADNDETSEHATLLNNARRARSLRPGGIVVGGYKVSNSRSAWDITPITPLYTSFQLRAPPRADALTPSCRARTSSCLSCRSSS